MAARKTPPPVPQPRKRPASDNVRRSVRERRDAERKARQAGFLAEFGQRGLVASSAKAAGIHRDTVYDWLKTDEAFAAEYDVVNTLVTEKAEAEAWRRAIDGWEEPVWYEGVQCGTTTKFDSGLLTLVLKARAPEKYRERLDLRHSGPAEPTEADRLLLALVGDAGKRAAAEALLDSVTS